MHPIIDFKSSIFNEYNSSYYQYHLLFSAYQCCYTVKDTLRNSYILLRDYNIKKDFNRSDTFLQVQNILRHEAIAELKPAKVFVMLHSPYYTLVPAALYSEPHKNDIMHQLFASDKLIGHRIHSQRLKDDVVMIFAVDKLLEDLLKKYLGEDLTLLHAAGLTISDLQAYLPSGEQEKAFVYVRQFSADIVVFKGRKLLLANTFEYQNHVEFLYYLIFMLEQCDTDTNTCPVVLLGELEQDSMLYSELFKYVRHLDLFQHNHMGTLDKSIIVKPHFYFNLFSTSLENY